MKKRTIGVLILTILAAVVAVWLLLRPRTYVAEMSELVPHQFGLRVGPALLGWSSHANSPSERNGYIYMRDVEPSGGNKPLWEFALTAKRRLSDVSRDDLRCSFFGMDDPRGPTALGEAWGGATILVPEGQVFFARLLSKPSVVYVIRLVEQGGAQSGKGTMRIEYRVFKAVSKTVQATATEPVSSMSIRWHNTVVAVASAAASGCA